MFEFPSKFNIITPEQCGFKPAHSTKHAIINLVNNIIPKLKNKESVIVVFIDISKAFGCVDHKILGKKSEYYGFRSTANSWLTNYIQNRFQYISVNENTAELKKIWFHKALF